MKKIFLALFALFTIGVSAQNNAMSKYFSEYQSREDFTQVQLTGKIFEIIASLDNDDEDTKEAQQLFENINGIWIVATENTADGDVMYKSAIKKLKGFELLMNVKEKDADFSIMVDEYNGTIEELVMIGGGKDNFVIVDIYGEIDLNQLTKVMSFVKDQQGNLSIDNDTFDSVELYPNPVKSGNSFHIKVDENMIGASCKVYNTKGAIVWEGRVENTDTECNVRKLRSGVYAVEIENEGVLIRKKIVVQ